MPKRDYLLVQGMSAGELSASVTAGMAEGWELYETPFASIAKNETGLIVETLYQAMIRTSYTLLPNSVTVPAQE